MNNIKEKRKLTKQQIEVASLLSAISSKTSITGPAIFPIVGKFKSRFGYALCAEVFQTLPDMSGRSGSDFVSYTERCLQNAYVKRNPQGPDRVLVGLSNSIGR